MNLKQTIKNHPRIAIAIAIGIVGVIAIAIGKGGSNPKYFKVRRDVFEAIVPGKGEIQSEKAILITVPDLFGDRTLEIYETQIKDLIPEGSIVKKGDYVALLDQGRMKQLKEANDEQLRKTLFNLNDSKIDSAVALVNLRDDMEQFVFDLQYKKLDLEQSIYESPAYQRRSQMSYDRALRQLESKKRSYNMNAKSWKVRIERTSKYIDELTLKSEKYAKAIEESRITAPNDGMLIYGRTFGRGGSRKLTIGSYVSRQMPVIATLPDLTDLVSETYVEEIYVAKMKVGDSARVYVDALKGVVKAGVISAISNVGQEMDGIDSKVFKVNIRISTDDKNVKPAMTTNNEIILSHQENVLVIPRSAIVTEEGKLYVYLHGLGKPKKQEIVCSAFSEKQAVVKSGLKEGDKIFLEKPVSE